MVTVSAREANQQFSRILEAAVGGQEVTITRRGVPVAKLVPLKVDQDAAAAELASVLGGAGRPPLGPVEANEVFVRLPRTEIARLRAAGLRAADWPNRGDDAGNGTIRMVTSWATTDEEIAALRAVL